MIQKRSCSLRTKVNRPFHDMEKIRVAINFFFAIFETLFQNVTAILPITYQNKTKVPGESKICLVIYKKRQAISTIYKLSEYNFW